MKYIAATLVGAHKLYCKERFWECIDGLTQQPETFFISTTKEVFDKFTDGKSNRVHIQGVDDKADDRIRSTTSAREAIRVHSLEYMEKHPNVKWTLWLDNDIGVPMDLIDRFDGVVADKSSLVMAHSYHPARQDGEQLRHGMACTFTHRDVLASYPFTRAHLRGANYGDDQIWLSVMSQLGRFTWRDDYEMIGGTIFDTIHFVEDGREKTLPDHLRGDLV